MFDYILGQWASLNRVLAYLNTIETRQVAKKEVYEAVSNMNPYEKEYTMTFNGYEENGYIFGISKQNFLVDTRVIIGRTNSNLDGEIGIILGKSFDNVVDSYIVFMDTPYMGQKAINLTEVCLAPYKEPDVMDDLK